MREIDLIIKIKNGTAELDLVLNRLSNMGYVWNSDNRSLTEWKPFSKLTAIYLRENRRVLYGEYAIEDKKDTSIDAEVFLRITGCFKNTEQPDLTKLIGKTVRITENYSGHSFKIGSAAFIVDAEAGAVQALGYTTDGTANVFYLMPEDYEVIEDE